MKTVIVYSSATGNTARLAQELSAQLNLPAMPGLPRNCPLS